LSPPTVNTLVHALNNSAGGGAVVDTETVREYATDRGLIADYDEDVVGDSSPPRVAMNFTEFARAYVQLVGNNSVVEATRESLVDRDDWDDDAYGRSTTVTAVPIAMETTRTTAAAAAFAARRRQEAPSLDGDDSYEFDDDNDGGDPNDEDAWTDKSRQPSNASWWHRRQQKTRNHRQQATASSSFAGRTSTIGGHSSSSKHAATTATTNSTDRGSVVDEDNDNDRRHDGHVRGGRDALRRAFTMYDMNGDGVITYGELKGCFRRQGRDASDFELREWIRERDTSGTGAVSFEDFARAFEGL
jgi:hypothetical protein